LVSDRGFGTAAEDRRQLLEANVIAAQYFRGELLWATGGWPLQYLKDEGIGHVLAPDSPWKIGYAPDTRTGLVDHLAAENFSYSTMECAGLVTRSGEAEVVDRFRSQLVLVARDAQLHPVGFVGIAEDGQTRTLSPATPIHQPSNVLVGIDEQLDLLRAGASPIIVDDPVEAIAVSTMSRALDGRWAGIPVCGDGLSTAQVRMLRKYSSSDTAVVVAAGDDYRRKLTTGYLLDLARSYDKVQALVLPASPSALAADPSGAHVMNDILVSTRPLLTYRFGAHAESVHHDPEPADRGPDL
jgi:hypothetical protein